jgi:cytochrome bd ubiquinol oxidase subunit II
MLLGWAVLSATIAFLALWFRAFTVARTAAVTLVTLILAGWALAQFPHLVTPDVTIENTATPQSTLRLLMLVLGAGAVALLPSILYLFQIFKGQEQR